MIIASPSSPYLWTALLALLPVSELRGAIPYALHKGLSLWFVYPYCLFWNALVAPLSYLFFNFVHRKLWPLASYRTFFEWTIGRKRKQIARLVNRFGFWGLTLFVALPLPITGAWTGTAGAWLLGIPFVRTLKATTLGISISGLLIISLILLLKGTFRSPF